MAKQMGSVEGGGGGGGSGDSGAGEGLWTWGSHYEGADVGDGMEANGGPISGSTITLPAYDDLYLIEAPFDLTIDQILIRSNTGGNDTEFGLYLGAGVGTLEQSWQYAGGVWKIEDDELDIACPAGTLVGVRWFDGSNPQYTQAHVHWTKDNS